MKQAQIVKMVVKEALMMKESEETYYKVNMAIVKKKDSSPPYIKLVNKIIRDGDGLVQIKEE